MNIIFVFFYFQFHWHMIHLTSGVKIFTNAQKMFSPKMCAPELIHSRRLYPVKY